MAKGDRTIVLEWGDVKQKFLDVVERGKRWDTQPAMGPKLMRMHQDPYKKKKRGLYDYDYLDDNWEGGTGADTLKWLREGYFAPEFIHAAEYVPTALKTRHAWNEEDGDPDIGRLISGRDDFFLGGIKRLAKPGLRIQIEFAFAWTVNSKTIQEYGAWVAGFLGSLESSGFDIVVDMWIPLERLYVGDAYNQRSNVLIRVKRPNEVSHFTEWSALFSPTGYRHLGFTAKCVAGDKIGKQAVGTLGMTIGGKSWGVNYDKDKALVTITVNQRAGGYESFPAELLSKQAYEAGLIPRPANYKGDL